MQNDNREFQLNAKQAEFVARQVSLDAAARDCLAPGRGATLVLTKDRRDEIVEQLGTLLQKRGFDTEWKASDEGLLIESIIDVLTADRSAR